MGTQLYGFDALKRDWDLLGQADPMWAVLNDPERSGRAWTTSEFLATGVTEITMVFNYLSDNGIEILGNGHALDFGCGAGRLTQALSQRFTQVTGVDIAASMIQAGRAIDPPANCSFVLNERPDLSLFPDGSLDFIYSSIVLQHMAPGLALNYIAEFCRCVRPGGIVAFQIPTNIKRTLAARMHDAIQSVTVRIALRSRIRGLFRSGGNSGCSAREPDTRGNIRMHVVSEAAVREVLQQHKVHCLVAPFTNSCALSFNGNLELFTEPKPQAGFISQMFVGQKPVLATDFRS